MKSFTTNWKTSIGGIASMLLGILSLLGVKIAGQQPIDPQIALAMIAAGWSALVAADASPSPLPPAKMLIAIFILPLACLFVLLAEARAGDIASPTIPALPIKIPAVKPVNCTAGNCSGFYGLFTLTDYSQNVSLPGIGSSAANDLGLQAGFGYQLWSGQLLAGLQTQWGDEFVSQGVASPGSHLTGEVTAHLGYNFFNGLTPATGQPVTSGQNPFAGLVPSTLLQNSTPYLIGGGCLRHGIMEACAGIGIETAIASSWSAAFEYKNAPTQRGQPDVSVFSLSVKKHFSLGSL